MSTDMSTVSTDKIDLYESFDTLLSPVEIFRNNIFQELKPKETKETKDPKESGHLSLLIGCMFAQKTTELLRRIRRYQSIGYSVLIVNYIGDTRYGSSCIITHDKDSENAVCVDKLQEIDTLVRSHKYSVVAIDEGQFFTDLFEYVTSWVDNYNIHVVVAGLDGTSDRKPFGMLQLIPHAEEVERLHAFCAICRDGTFATFSKCVSSKNTDILIGGSESYYPVCRKHYL